MARCCASLLPLTPAGAQATHKSSSGILILDQPLKVSSGVMPDGDDRCFLGGLTVSFPVGSRSGLDVW